MATLELCDLCNSKVKRDFIRLFLNGKIQLFEGSPPPAPDGFKYAEDESEKGKSYKKVWDHFGRLVSETYYLPIPKKHRDIEIRYDICEMCAQRLIAMFEDIRQRYHLEQKEIKLLDEPDVWWNRKSNLLGHEDL